MIIIDLHPQISLDKKCTEIAVGKDGKFYFDPREDHSKKTDLTTLKVLHTGRTVTSEAQYQACLILWTREFLKDKGAYEFDDNGDPVFCAEGLSKNQ